MKTRASIGGVLLLITVAVVIGFMVRDDSRRDAAVTAESQSRDETARVMLDQAEASWRKGDLDAAKRLYQDVRNQTKGEELRLDAGLGLVRLQRVERRFAEAIADLDALKQYDKSHEQLRIRMARAEVYFDMEDYERAREDVRWVIDQSPKHPEALILRAKIQLKTQFVGKAIDDDWGQEIRNHEIQLGQPLVLNFHDPTLESNQRIEVSVTSDSGDQENLMLHPVDAKPGNFRGQVPTLSGKPVVGDKLLQTRIGDRIVMETKPRADIPAGRVELKVVESK